MSGSTLGQLIEKKNRDGFLEGRDAILFLSLKRSGVPVSVDTSALLSRLAALLPTDLQLERRKRKLAWHIAKGKRVRCQWDLITLSELTPAEHSMSDDGFASLYPDQVPTARKGGRPSKYRTVSAQKRANAERQRQFRARTLAANLGRNENPLAA